MWLVYFLLWTAVTANGEPLYREIGDKAVLTPDSVESPIYSIVWKHGPDIAIEWYGNETFSYRQFKDRGSLDISTRALTIKGLTQDESGIYRAEINNKDTSNTQLQVISPVPKPNISVSCEMTYCVLTCEGNIKGAEPVTCWWRSGDIVWNSTNQHKITKEEKKSLFNCAFSNPVSFNGSEKVLNPFIERNGAPTFTVVGAILAMCFSCCCCCCCCKCLTKTRGIY
ncbi:uncharacterized protein LOC121892015 [Scomber scombrus]|uniref:Uncharacterized protein LOC121892015 n=1 Tax=Scomber scombrus TaxID=13677 RepID=A0AAV1PUP5_SCOSC